MSSTSELPFSPALDSPLCTHRPMPVFADATLQALDGLARVAAGQSKQRCAWCQQWVWDALWTDGCRSGEAKGEGPRAHDGTLMTR